MISRRSVLTAGVLAPLGWAAAAETCYRAHSVTVVNPFAAGGQSEPIGRIVNTHFQSALGQPFVMENRVGAGSTIGGQYVVRSAPDGYTLLLGTTSTFTIAPYVYRPQPYDPTTNLAPIIALTEAPTVLVASEKSGFEVSRIWFGRRKRSQVASQWLPPASAASRTSSQRSFRRSSECNLVSSLARLIPRIGPHATRRRFAKSLRACGATASRNDRLMSSRSQRTPSVFPYATGARFLPPSE